MPDCALVRELPAALRRFLAALSIAWVTAGCAPTGDSFGIHIVSLEARTAHTGVAVRAHQEISLSREAREALRHGVPLRIRVDLRMRGDGQWRPAEESTFIFEVRYLPLSDHYQLAGPRSDSSVKTFPRLRHVLAELGDVELNLPDANATPGQFEVRMRSRLDRSAMPAPMQLPTLLSPNWNHDSGWVASDVQVGG